jgi:hypothetical protein
MHQTPRQEPIEACAIYIKEAYLSSDEVHCRMLNGDKKNTAL